MVKFVYQKCNAFRIGLWTELRRLMSLGRYDKECPGLLCWWLSEQKASQPPRPLSACGLSMTRWPRQFFVSFFYAMLGADPVPGACQTSTLLLSDILTQASTSSEGN